MDPFERRRVSVDPNDKQPELSSPNPKAPYQRPKLERIGTLRDVTAQKTGNDLAPS
jgi:hypothetical protein